MSCNLRVFVFPLLLVLLAVIVNFCHGQGSSVSSNSPNSPSPNVLRSANYYQNTYYKPATGIAKDSYKEAADDFGYGQNSNQQAEYAAPGGAGGYSGGYSGGDSNPSYNYGVSSNYGVSQSYGSEYGEEEDQEEEEGGIGNLGKKVVAKIIGKKALKKLGLIKAVKLILGPVIFAPILLPLLLPLILLALLPILLILLPILLFLPIPVVFVPVPAVVRRSLSLTTSGLMSKMSNARKIIESSECIEKISCEIRNVAKDNKIDKWISKNSDNLNEVETSEENSRQNCQKFKCNVMEIIQRALGIGNINIKNNP